MTDTTGRPDGDPEGPHSGEQRPRFAPPVPSETAGGLGSHTGGSGGWVPPGSSAPAGGSAAPESPHSPGGSDRPAFRHAGEPSSTRTLVLSGWWRRAGAAILDGVIVAFIALAIGVAFGIADDAGTGTAATQTVGTATTLILLAVVALYAPLMMWRTNGRTVGRMVTGIRVVRANGERMTLGVAFIREVLIKSVAIGVASQYTFGLVGLTDILWPLRDRENRALHDFPVDTRTIID